LLTAPEDADADSEDDGSWLIAKCNPSGENKKEDIDNVLIISRLVSLVNVKFLFTKIILRKEKTPARQFRSLESKKKLILNSLKNKVINGCSVRIFVSCET